MRKPSEMRKRLQAARLNASPGDQWFINECSIWLLDHGLLEEDE